MSNKSAIQQFITSYNSRIPSISKSNPDILELALAIQADLSDFHMLEVYVKDLIKRVDDLEAIKKDGDNLSSPLKGNVK